MIKGALDSDDTRYMATALQQIGISLTCTWDEGAIEVDGCDGQLPGSEATLFLGNSGTSMRFLTALCALGNGRFVLDGTERMRARPLGPLINGLQTLGVDIRSVNGNGCPPLIVQAAGVNGAQVSMRGDLSSQYFSGLAMILPYAAPGLTISVEGNLVSKPYLDITADSMQAFGVELRINDYRSFSVPASEKYVATTYEVEPDASAASYFYALAAVTSGTVRVERLPWSSKQGDLKFVDVLERMGCQVDRSGFAVTVTGPTQLRGVDVDMSSISDTVMTLAAIAPFADRPVAIRNVGHIRVKETDRIDAIVTELRRMSIKVDEAADGMVIHPGSPTPATVETYDDHRMAMAFALTGTQVQGIKIADPGCVAKTVPGYWDLLFPLLNAPLPSIV